MEKVEIILENGISKVVNCILYVYNSNYYFLYTDNEVDDKGSVKFYIVKVVKQNINEENGTSTTYLVGMKIPDDIEWNDILGSVSKILVSKKNKVKDNSIKYLSANKLEKIHIISKSSFSLLSSVVDSCFKVGVNNLDTKKNVVSKKKNKKDNKVNNKNDEKKVKNENISMNDDDDDNDSDEDNDVIDKENKTESEIYEEELDKEFKKLKKIDTNYKLISYFVDTIKIKLKYNDVVYGKPSIILIGTFIPEILIYASKNIPYWVTGSLSSAMKWSDSFVPRDTDSISRAILGVILNKKRVVSKDTLIIIPLISDNFKKISYMLTEMGYNVYCIYVPPLKTDTSLKEWHNQIELCIQKISSHTKRYIGTKSLNYVYSLVKKAKYEIDKFINLSKNNSIISGLYKMIVLYSYYCMQNIEDWVTHLNSLNTQLSKMNNVKKKEYKGNVIVMGSPIYFPNFKIPFLLDEIGLNVLDIFDYSMQKFHIPMGNDYKEYIDNCFLYDISSASVSNDVLYSKLEKILEEKSIPIEGVVYHIIKGEIDFDFELERFEKLFAKYDVPLFRLETDYHFQDIEQLRIRMEAFAEVIGQKKYTKESS